MVTIIRHKTTKDGFVVVVTHYNGTEFTATMQHYVVSDGKTILYNSQPFSSERGAINYFNNYVETYND